MRRFTIRNLFLLVAFFAGLFASMFVFPVPPRFRIDAALIYLVGLYFVGHGLKLLGQYVAIEDRWKLRRIPTTWRGVTILCLVGYFVFTHIFTYTTYMGHMVGPFLAITGAVLILSLIHI